MLDPIPGRGFTFRTHSTTTSSAGEASAKRGKLAREAREIPIVQRRLVPVNSPACRRGEHHRLRPGTTCPISIVPESR